jgi:anti-sigma regulatory factor (Ser/Thr protein kinase)
MDTICEAKRPIAEDLLWIEFVRPWLAAHAIMGEAMKIANYVTTEMLNNVRDHSESGSVVVRGDADATSFVIHVVDEGVGVFRRLADGLGLSGPREAVIEVAKGKRTTDPAQHTGQGIFFSSRVCDWFCLEANGFAVSFERDGRVEPLEFLGDRERMGTTVKFRISRQPGRSLRQVFDEYCPQPDIDFVRTRIAVRLMAEADGSLVSRSQARRLMAGLDQFTQVELDFDGVAEIAQGFADEVFRVWSNAHPAVTLRALNAGEEVDRMLRHVGVRR